MNLDEGRLTNHNGDEQSNGILYLPPSVLSRPFPSRRFVTEREYGPTNY